MKLSLPNYQQADVLIVGDVMLDRYWYGPTQRISPEAPVPVVKIDNTEERPGGAANVAMNIAGLGGKARLIGLVGMDEQANVLATKLTPLNVDCHFVPIAQKPTITKLRIMSRNQQLIRLDFEQPFSSEDSLAQMDKIVEQLPLVKVAILSDYAKGALCNVQLIIEQARRFGVKTLVDPKGTDFERYRGATLLTPNMGEFEAVVGHCANEQQIEQKGLQLIEQLQLEALLVTRSEHGMMLIRKGVP
ncbi:MAG: PfkB family carbohydrate kinase, partial [Vibrionaceae bacterium]